MDVCNNHRKSFTGFRASALEGGFSQPVADVNFFFFVDHFNIPRKKCWLSPYYRVCRLVNTMKYFIKDFHEELETVLALVSYPEIALKNPFCTIIRQNLRLISTCVLNLGLS